MRRMTADEIRRYLDAHPRSAAESVRQELFLRLREGLDCINDRLKRLEKPEDVYVIASVTDGKLDGGLRIDCRGQRMVLDANEAEYIADALVKTVRDLRK